MQVFHFSRLTILLTAVFLFQACEKTHTTIDCCVPELLYPHPVGSIGAVGNSITAGYISGGWSAETISKSYVALLARRVYGSDRVGVTDDDLFLYAGIRPPGMPAPARLNSQTQVGERADGSPVYRLDITPAGSLNLNNLAPLNMDSERIFNNLAVPGYKAIDVMQRVSFYNSQGDLNPLYSVSLRNRGTAIDQLVELDPTTALVWIGNNEVLGYALSGGTGKLYPIETNDDGTVPGFRDLMEELVSRLRKPGRNIFLFTVPDVSAIPAVSFVGEALSDGTRGTVIDINGDGVFSDTLSFYGMAEGMPRVLTSDEYVLMDWFLNNRDGSTNAEGQLYGLHPENPLPNNRFLSANQLENIRSRTAAFNAIIEGLTNGEDVHLVDTHTFFNEVVANGYQFPGDQTVFTTDFISGGLFSLDGVHPSEMGHRAAANFLIDRINEVYGISIPLLSSEETGAVQKRFVRGHISGMDGSAYENARRVVLSGAGY